MPAKPQNGIIIPAARLIYVKCVSLSLFSLLKLCFSHRLILSSVCALLCDVRLSIFVIKKDTQLFLK